MASKLEKQRPGLSPRLLLSSKARKESLQKLLFCPKKAQLAPDSCLEQERGSGGPLRLPKS